MPWLSGSNLAKSKSSIYKVLRHSDGPMPGLGVYSSVEVLLLAGMSCYISPISLVHCVAKEYLLGCKLEMCSTVHHGLQDFVKPITALHFMVLQL